MPKASIRDLHIRTSELVKTASEGAVIMIERRGEQVAELRPLTPQRPKPKFPDRAIPRGKPIAYPKGLGDQR
jgi:antitoxin (DNA-binding transcriptional repressor) of toxin-antitoxin stability system